MRTRTKVVEKAIRQARYSKYRWLLALMAESLRRDGADGKRRAIEQTAAWRPRTLRRWARGLRYYYRTHRLPGFRLSVVVCAANGLTFRWVGGCR